MCVCVIEQNTRYCSKVIPRNDLTNKCHPHYTGLLESYFKDRLCKHKNFFKYESNQNAMELSNFIWDKENKRVNVSLKWNNLYKAKSYSAGSRNCNLCLTEKYHVFFSGLNLLNKRHKLVSKCRHENRYYFSNYNSVLP